MRRKIDYTITPVIFYRFVCKDPTIKNSYVGHTTNFVKRKNNHKVLCHNSDCKEYNWLIYTTIRNNGGWNNWTMIEIDSKIVLNKKEAIKIEQEYINEFSNNMNTQNSYSGYDTKQEYDKAYSINNRDKVYKNTKKYQNSEKGKLTTKLYNEKNKEKIAEQKKLYRELNIEKISEQKKLSYEKNKEQIAERQKLYNEKNKEKIAERNKLYRELNKEKISELKKLYYEKNKKKQETNI